MDIVTLDFRKYGHDKYFIFDSDEWIDRIFIPQDNPEQTLRLISNLMKDSNVVLKCNIDLLKLVNMIIKKKIKDFEIQC